MCGKRGFGKRERVRPTAFGEPQAREVPTRDVRGRMLEAQRLLVVPQCALVQRPRRREVALLLKHKSEVVEAPGGRGMLWAEQLLVDRQRPLVERLRATRGRPGP